MRFGMIGPYTRNISNYREGVNANRMMGEGAGNYWEGTQEVI